MRPSRYWLGLLLAGATLLGGCALNGDFGRVRNSLVNDDMHDWVGRDAIRSIGGRPSEFRLTDDERRLRDLAFALIQPPYDRQRWDAVFAEYGLEGPRDGAPFDRTAYWAHLDANYRRSEASSYAQIVADARNDVVRIEPFFATAARVVDMDRRRAESLRYVAASSSLSEAESASALSRNDENTAVIEWVCRSLTQRAQSYRYALERLVVSTPSASATDVERALTLLRTRTEGYCATAPRVVAKG
ncbi:MAG TPA: hypothetical protein VIY51_20315 [Xanthobacteraceae bacterium]